MNVKQKKKKNSFILFRLPFTEIFLYHEMSKQKLYNETSKQIDWKVIAGR
jgi:hypothetical protein